MISAEDLKSAIKIYRQVAKKEFIDSLLKSAGVVEQRGGIFSAAVVVWLMIFQRLSPDHTLSAAIEYLKVGGVQQLLDAETKSLKVRSGRISSCTGGYSQGRGRLPLSVVEQVTEVLNKELSENKGEPRIYAVDGTTVLVSCSESLVSEYSQHGTRLGKSHYPLVRVELATDVLSGMASNPVVGAHNGSKATSEIGLVQEVLTKLETGSIILADRYYGVTQVVQCTKQLGLQLVVRLKDSVAEKLIQKKSQKSSGVVDVIWRPSEYEKKRYPHLADAAIAGRCIWQTIEKNGFQPFKLFLFTTCNKTPDEVVDLYGLRWNVEQDLRDLKTTLGLNFVSAKSPDMIKKEILTGIAAYNLIRHFMKVVAGQLKTSVRNISFKASLRRFYMLGNNLLSSSSENENQITKNMFIALTDLKALLLPIRKKIRDSPPRQKWRKGVQRYRDSVPFVPKAK